MAKKYKEQKKKTLINDIADVLFKILVAIAVLIFIYIIIEKTDFSSGSMEFTTIKKSSPVTHTPSELKWFDTFKGVENVPNKNAKEDSNGNTGFKYEGFKK